MLPVRNISILIFILDGESCVVNIKLNDFLITIKSYTLILKTDMNIFRNIEKNHKILAMVPFEF